MTKIGGDFIWQEALRPLSVARLFWKQRFVVFALWIALSACAVILVLRVPPVYRAEAVILVDSQSIPEKFVNSTGSADLREQLATLSQQVLSSAQLWKIIEKFDLYPEARHDLPMQEVVDRIRTDLQIRVEDGLTSARSGAFRISYRGADPGVTAQVVNQLAALFMDQNLHTREKNAEGTEQFIKSQLDQAKQALEEQEKRLTEYKLEHNGELPEQQGALTASLAQLNLQLQGVHEAISRAYTSQATLEGNLRVAEAVAEISKRLQNTGPDASGKRTSQAGVDNPEDVLKAMEAELATLLTKFTDSHPRVRLLRASIARLKALEEKEQLSSSIDPEHTEGLKMQLAAVERELKDRTLENDRLLREIQSTNLRISRIPLREQEIAALSRDYEMSKANYQSLVDKLYGAKMTADMEHRQQAERFTMLEPAHVPTRPVKPNRAMLLEIGELLALAVAMSAGFAIEMKRNRVLGEWELPAHTAVYARVPSMGARMRTPPPVRVRVRTHGPLQSAMRFLAPNQNRDADAAPVQFLTSNRVIGPAQQPVHPLAMQPGSAPIAKTVRRVLPGSPTLCLLNPDPMAVEQYRIARTRIEHDPANPKLLVVSSACSGDGKTVSALNLATVWSMRRDLQVLLVEADFHHACLANMLGIPPRPGLSDVLMGKCELGDALVVVEQLPNLFVLPAGGYDPNVTEMLAGPAWDGICKLLRERFDYVIFDTPPVGPVADYALIEKKADGVLLVVRPDHTDRSLLRIARGLVFPDKLMGVLLNDVKDWFLWKTPSSYYGYPIVASSIRTGEDEQR